jgi:hypothetical protein
MENDENRNPKSESNPNDEVRKCCDREKTDVATPAELICENLRNLWSILFKRGQTAPREHAHLWLLGGGEPVNPVPARVGPDVRAQRPPFD